MVAKGRSGRSRKEEEGGNRDWGYEILTYPKETPKFRVWGV